MWERGALRCSAEKEWPFCVWTGGADLGRYHSWDAFSFCPANLSLLLLPDWQLVAPLSLCQAAMVRSAHVLLQEQVKADCASLRDGEEKCWPRPERRPITVPSFPSLVRQWVRAEVRV